jgi:hypothetical protein
VYGWYFNVTMRQSFDYSDYPLDSHSACLRIWPKDFISDDIIFLIADFEAYELVTGPDGLQNLPKKFGLDVDKEFYFNLGIRRKFRNTFVINLVPLFVVALLLFALVMTITGDEDHAKTLSGLLAGGTLDVPKPFETPGALAT